MIYYLSLTKVWLLQLTGNKKERWWAALFYLMPIIYFTKMEYTHTSCELVKPDSGTGTLFWK